MRAVRIAGAVLVVSALAAAVLVDARAEAPLTITRHYTPADRVSGRYQYVPFEVPAGTATLRVSSQYDRVNGDNVVDLGVFEPGPLDLGTHAFRGYSGGAKTGFEIGARETSSGYRPGPLPPGQWHVMLGLYQVAERGVDVTLTIETEAGAPGPAARPLHVPVAIPPSTAPAGWLMGALHTHTLHSDGTVSPAEIMRITRDAGFDFVAITDHNNTTHSYELARDAARPARPLWIVGEEVTTPGGHASVWGLSHDAWIDFRVGPGDPRIADLVSAARRLGAVFSVNHPASTCIACGWEHAFVDGIEAMEISNGRHGEVTGALAMWDKLLRSGRRITGVGSSDWHSAPNPIDVANVRVYSPALTQDAILGAIRAGRVIVVNGAQEATPQVVVRAGNRSAGIGDSLAISDGTVATIDVHAPGLVYGRLLIVGNGGTPVDVPLDDRGRARVERPVQFGYVRFEFRRQDQSPVAYTNPVYIVPQ